MNKQCGTPISCKGDKPLEDKRCGTCLRWKPPDRPKYTKTGGCPFRKEAEPDNKPVSWCWGQASPEQLKSRVKAGLIILDL